MSEKKKKIGFTVACVNEFAQHYNLSIQEAFRYLFQFKGIAFIKENYEVEHTLDFETIIEDLAMCRPYKDFGKGFYLTDIKEQAEKMAVRLSKIYGVLLLSILLYRRCNENLFQINDQIESLEVSLLL